MSDDKFDDGPHELLIRAFIEYFTYNDRFKRRSAFEPSVKARHALSDIRKYATMRRDEIKEIRNAAKEAKDQQKPNIKGDEG
jgi:hypothetical protein